MILGSKVFMMIDLKDTFNQIAVKEEDKDWMAFCCYKGTFLYMLCCLTYATRQPLSNK